MKRDFARLAAVAAAVFALDRWTKLWASTALPFDRPVPILGEFLRLTYTRNSGVAFGLGQGTGFPYYVFSLAAAAVIVWLFATRRVAPGPRQLALALILGGALGNLVDRIATGEVVDFIEIGVARWHWPVFNVADSAVSVGVVLFALARAPRAADRDGRDGGALHEGEAGSAGPGPQGRGAPGPLPGGGAGGPVA